MDAYCICWYESALNVRRVAEERIIHMTLADTLNVYAVAGSCEVPLMKREYVSCDKPRVSKWRRWGQYSRLSQIFRCAAKVVAGPKLVF